MIRRKVPALPSLRAFVIAVAGGLMALATVVAVAPPADAAAPRCTGNGLRYYWSGGQLSTNTWITFPAHSPNTNTFGGFGFWSCSLVQGSTGPAVKTLQQDINACYPGLSPVLKEDGQFGSRTLAALAEVQESHAIVDNGQYGPETARTMYHHRYWRIGSPGSGCSDLSSFGWPGNTG